MTREEVLDGLTNDLVLHRLRKFLVAKGLPDGKYLLADASFTQGEKDIRHQGKIEMSLPRANRKVTDETQFAEDVRVVISFTCAHHLDANLSLDIRSTKAPIRRRTELIYRFVGVLRPIEENTQP